MEFWASTMLILAMAVPRTQPSRPAADAATEFLRRTAIEATTQIAMLTVLRQHQDQNRWSGRDGKRLFAITVKRLPDTALRQRATPMLLSLAHSLAVNELLTAKSVLDAYAGTGLEDSTTLREAVATVSDALVINGHARLVAHGASTEADFAVAYVIADAEGLNVSLAQPAALGAVRAAYRDVMHKQARELMGRNNWADAVLLWKHLHQRRLVSPGLYLDAATCFRSLRQDHDAMRVLMDAMETFGTTSSADFLERAGDLALEIGTPEAQALAERAFKAASARLQNTSIAPARPATTQARPDDEGRSLEP